MSQFQLIPYKRIQDYFREQLDIPVSDGSIYNFNEEAYDLLEAFDEKVKAKLASSDLLHVDETGINMNGDKRWLLCVSNGSWTYFWTQSVLQLIPTQNMGTSTEIKQSS